MGVVGVTVPSLRLGVPVQVGFEAPFIVNAALGEFAEIGFVMGVDFSDTGGVVIELTSLVIAASATCEIFARCFGAPICASGTVLFGSEGSFFIDLGRGVVVIGNFSLGRFLYIIIIIMSS